jgi:tetratricopeptide (TPR) repeat protein
MSDTPESTEKLSSFEEIEAERGARGRRDKSFWWLIGIVLMGALGLAAVPVAKKVYPMIKDARGRKLAVEIQQLLDERKYEAASGKVRNAITMAPREPKVIRVTARFCTVAGLTGEALKYWQTLLQTPEATDQDRYDYIETAVANNRLDLSRPVLAQMLEKTPNDRSLLKLLIRQHAALKDFTRAVAAARYLMSLDPFDQHAQFLLGTLLTGSPQERERGEGRRLLWSLAISPGERSMEALDYLSDDPTLTAAESDQLIRRLEGMDFSTNAPATAALAKLQTSMRAADLRLRFKPERRAELVESILGNSATKDTNVSVKLMVGNWLLRQDPARIAQWLSADTVGTNLALVSLRAQGLAEAGRWDDLAPLLEPDGGLDPALSTFLKGRSAVAKNQLAEAESSFRTTIELLDKDVRLMPTIGRTAEQAGLTNVAMIAWERALSEPRLAMDAARQLIRLARPLDDLTTMRRAVQRMSDFFATDESFAGERALLDLLFSEDLVRSTSVLQQLVKNRPDNMTWKAGLALAHLRAQDPQKALSVFEETTIDFAGLAPRAQAIYVATLGQNQQREAARRFVRRMDLTQLKLQERELVRPWL